MGFYFCLRFRRHFFRPTKFENFKISKNRKIEIIGIIEKCVGCILVYPFLEGGGGGLLKNVKKVCICDYDKNRIVTCEKCFSSV